MRPSNRKVKAVLQVEGEQGLPERVNISPGMAERTLLAWLRFRIIRSFILSAIGQQFNPGQLHGGISRRLLINDQ